MLCFVSGNGAAVLSLFCPAPGIKKGPGRKSDGASGSGMGRICRAGGSGAGEPSFIPDMLQDALLHGGNIEV